MECGFVWWFALCLLEFSFVFVSTFAYFPISLSFLPCCTTVCISLPGILLGQYVLWCVLGLIYEWCCWCISFGLLSGLVVGLSKWWIGGVRMRIWVHDKMVQDMLLRILPLFLLGWKQLKESMNVVILWLRSSHPWKACVWRLQELYLWEPSSNAIWRVHTNPFIGHTASVEGLQWSLWKFVCLSPVLWIGVLQI